MLHPHKNTHAAAPTGASEARDMILLPHNDVSRRLSVGTRIGGPAVGGSPEDAATRDNDESSQDRLAFTTSVAESLVDLAHRNTRDLIERDWQSLLRCDGWTVHDDNNYDFKFNVSIVGSKGTGKRQMIISECESYDALSVVENRRVISWGLDVEFQDKTYRIKNKRVRVEYWIANTSDDVLTQSARILLGDRETYKSLFYTIAHDIIVPLTEDGDDLLHVKAMSNGYVRTRASITFPDKLAYTNMLETTEVGEELTSEVDWF
ncbi:hypothetical protein HDU84_001496 [Entophlyctis sp. JEL0112]|nr:hypothetical protein HDU84_001496 [Entophlyctis sp. JEL0112]